MDRKRRLMENNNGWPLRSQLLDGAPFRLPLTNTAVPASAASGTTATFTRATTATVRDNEGVLRTAIAGEARFEGARRVRNLLPSSEDLTSGWTATGGTLAAGSITESGATSGHYAQTTSMVIPATAIFIMQAEIKQSVGTRNIGIGTNSVGNAIFNPSTGVFVANDGATLDHGTGTQTADGYWPVWVKVQATTSNKPIISLYSGTTQSYAGDGASQVLVRKLQLEDVTAQTTQTAGEYVSVGVASSPYYHGSMVDGVKCFPTDLSGTPIAASTLLGYQAQGARTNICLQSNAFTTTWTKDATLTLTQNAVGPDGATSAWTLTDASAVGASYISQDITLTAASYTVSFFVKKTTGAQANYPVVLFYLAATTGLAGVTVDTSNGVATAWTAYTGFTGITGSATCVSYNSTYWRVSLTFTGTAAAWTLRMYPAGTTNPTQSTGTLDLTAQGSAVFYGAQVELGSFASSYIATTTVAVTRNADVEAVSTSGNIAAAAGSVYLEYTPTHSPSGTIAFWGTYVDASNYTAILHDATNLIFRKRIAGVNYDATIANAFVSGTTYKACATWGTSGTSITLNGTEGTPHANTTAAQIGSTMQWGADGNSLQQPFANIRNCRDWLRQLSASERTAVTA